jgi:hypothetical protein
MSNRDMLKREAIAECKIMAKETKQMEKETLKSPLVETELKQKQTVLDLDTMADADIMLVYKKITVNSDVPAAAQITALEKIVHPVEKRIQALCSFATSENYRVAKESALAKGNYLSSTLRSALTQIMSGIGAFAENSAKDNFAYWVEALKDAKNPDRQAKAKKLLERAKLLVDTEDIATM